MNQRNRVVTVSVAYVELQAALAAARRHGRRASEALFEVRVQAERLWSELDKVEVDAPLLRLGADLTHRFNLRGYDALHLAALLAVGAPSEVLLACWDNDLRTAAASLGYPLIPN